MRVDVGLSLRPIPGAGLLAGIAAVEPLPLLRLNVGRCGRFCLNGPERQAFAGITAAMLQGAGGAGLFAAVAGAAAIGHGGICGELQRGEDAG